MTSTLVDSVPTALSPSEEVLRVPGGRELEIYEEVVFAHRSQRNVAAEFGISQPRVNQILRVVTAWLAESTPGFAADLTPQQKLRLAHYNAEQQLAYHQHCLMEAWRKSQGQEKQSRTVMEMGVQRSVESQRWSFGNPRYLRESGRVALAMLKLAEWSPKGEKSQARGQTPPDGDLSLAAQKKADPKSCDSSAAAATPVETTPCAAVSPSLEPEKVDSSEMKNSLSLGTGPLVAEKARPRLPRPNSERLAGDGPLCQENREELAVKRKAFFGRGATTAAIR